METHRNEKIEYHSAIENIENYENAIPPHFEQEKAKKILENKEILENLKQLREANHVNYLKNLTNLGLHIDCQNFNTWLDEEYRALRKLVKDKTLWRLTEKEQNRVLDFERIVGYDISTKHIRKAGDSTDDTTEHLSTLKLDPSSITFDSFPSPELWTNSNEWVQKIVNLTNEKQISIPESYYILSSPGIYLDRYNIRDEERIQTLLQKFDVVPHNFREAVLTGNISNKIYEQGNDNLEDLSGNDEIKRVLYHEPHLHSFVKRLNTALTWQPTGLLITDRSARPLGRIIKLMWGEISNDPPLVIQFTNLHKRDFEKYSNQEKKQAINAWGKLGEKVILIDEFHHHGSTLDHLSRILSENVSKTTIRTKHFRGAMAPLNHGEFMGYNAILDDEQSTFVKRGDSKLMKTVWKRIRALTSLLNQDSMEHSKLPQFDSNKTSE